MVVGATVFTLYDKSEGFLGYLTSIKGLLCQVNHGAGDIKDCARSHDTLAFDKSWNNILWGQVLQDISKVDFTGAIIL
jgi:hypothetical protein